MAWSQRRLADLRYLLSWGLKQAEIARELRTSQQVVSYQVGKLRKEYYED